MSKNLLLLTALMFSLNSYAQLLGNIVSVNPNTAGQGQTLTTTITMPQGWWTIASPPCDNFGIYLMEGTDVIYSTSYNWNWPDELDAVFTIPAAAAIGSYDVYTTGSTWDWWGGSGCTTIGYWILNSGFFVYSTTIVPELTSPGFATVYPNPVIEKALLSFNNTAHEKYRVVIMDSFGKRLLNEVTSNENLELNRKDYPAGIYFYRLEGLENELQCTGKFVVIE